MLASLQWFCLVVGQECSCRNCLQLCARTFYGSTYLSMCLCILRHMHILLAALSHRCTPGIELLLDIGSHLLARPVPPSRLLCLPQLVADHLGHGSGESLPITPLSYVSSGAWYHKWQPKTQSSVYFVAGHEWPFWQACFTPGSVSSPWNRQNAPKAEAS